MSSCHCKHYAGYILQACVLWCKVYRLLHHRASWPLCAAGSAEWPGYLEFTFSYFSEKGSLLNSRLKAKYTVVIHTVYGSGLYFCLSSPETYTDLPCSTVLPGNGGDLTFLCRTLTLHFDLQFSSPTPAFGWTAKEEEEATH